MSRRRPPQSRSVAHGRNAEGDIARRLTRWADGAYVFERRGLGHAGVADLIVTKRQGAPAWPFAVSVKAGPGPTLTSMLRASALGRPWPWWRELEQPAGPSRLSEPEIFERRVRAWLVWHGERDWLLSVWTLGGLTVPSRMSLLPPPLSGWPRFTMLLEKFLALVTIEDAMKAIHAGWGTP